MKCKIRSWKLTKSKIQSPWRKWWSRHLKRSHVLNYSTRVNTVNLKAALDRCQKGQRDQSLKFKNQIMRLKIASRRMIRILWISRLSMLKMMMAVKVLTSPSQLTVGILAMPSQERLNQYHLIRNLKPKASLNNSTIIKPLTTTLATIWNGQIPPKMNSKNVN